MREAAAGNALYHRQWTAELAVRLVQTLTTNGEGNGDSRGDGKTSNNSPDDTAINEE